MGGSWVAIWRVLGLGLTLLAFAGDRAEGFHKVSGEGAARTFHDPTASLRKPLLSSPASSPDPSAPPYPLPAAATDSPPPPPPAPPPPPSPPVQVVIEDAPSTAAIVGGVVGGLSGLTLVLAVALLIATGSINQWWCCARWGLGHGGSSGEAGNVAVGSEGHAGAGSAQPMLGGSTQPSTPRSDWGMGMGGVLSLPRTAGTPPGTTPGSVVDGGGSGLASPRSSYSVEGWLTGRSTGSQRGPSSGDHGRASGGGGGARSSEDWGSTLRISAAWRDCLIDPAKVLVLRRPNGQPWRLGGGSFGQVYKALYDDVQVVAVKVLAGMSDPAQLEAFLREGRILKNCRDRNIVQFVGAACDPTTDQALLVTEYMEAGDLWRALRWRDEQGRRVFGWYNRGKKAALDAARGLHYLHSHGVIHLDLKSANILLARDGTAKLADVGLAKTAATKDYLTAVHTMGTFAWAAPEVLTGQKCDSKVDIFSWGVVCWEIATGEAPSRGTMRNIDVPAECPAEVRDLCDRCMAADPRQRPTAKQIVAALEAAGAGGSGSGGSSSRGAGKGARPGGRGGTQRAAADSAGGGRAQRQPPPTVPGIEEEGEEAQGAATLAAADLTPRQGVWLAPGPLADSAPASPFAQQLLPEAGEGEGDFPGSQGVLTGGSRWQEQEHFSRMPTLSSGLRSSWAAATGSAITAATAATATDPAASSWGTDTGLSAPASADLQPPASLELQPPGSAELQRPPAAAPAAAPGAQTSEEAGQEGRAWEAAAPISGAGRPVHAQRLDSLTMTSGFASGMAHLRGWSSSSSEGEEEQEQPQQQQQPQQPQQQQGPTAAAGGSGARQAGGAGPQLQPPRHSPPPLPSQQAGQQVQGRVEGAPPRVHTQRLDSLTMTSGFAVGMAHLRGWSSSEEDEDQ